MKYFKYTLWDKGDYKYSFPLRGDVSQINMPLFGEINEKTLQIIKIPNKENIISLNFIFITI